ncbi:hypothetical protein [Tolypothrix sp. NIES-4075]|uniref:hypothetical protein n=1 Tax=Tolypothrix sp. NIES-4075 TaxID=2005459 RepID=UPI001180BB30|nr:hypothetical protein [Tolypothrix sp. NIES-4075]
MSITLNNDLKTRLILVETRLILVETRLILVETRLILVETRLILIETRLILIETRCSLRLYNGCRHDITYSKVILLRSPLVGAKRDRSHHLTKRKVIRQSLCNSINYFVA